MEFSLVSPRFLHVWYKTKGALSRLEHKHRTDCATITQKTVWNLWRPARSEIQLLG